MACSQGGGDLSRKEHEAIDKLIQWRKGELSCPDETMVDSTRDYMLLLVGGHAYLVHRREKWRGVLDDDCIEHYRRHGRRAFRQIREHLDRIDATAAST